jgi:hypothetical protein
MRRPRGPASRSGFIPLGTGQAVGRALSPPAASGSPKRPEVSQNARSGSSGIPEPADGRSILLSTVSESDFQQHVIDVAEQLGYRHWHDNATNAPRRCSACGVVRRLPRNTAGFLDLILIRRPRLVWAELKAEDGVVSREQQAWIDDLRACGQEVYVWRPSDADELERILSDG